MKKSLFITLLLSLLGVGTVWAQPGQGAEKKLQHLTKVLQLNATQQTQVADLIQAQAEKFKQLKAENIVAMEAVLNEQQKQNFLQLREKRKQKRQNSYR